MIFSGSGFAGGFIAGFATGFCTREISRFVIKVSKPVSKKATEFGTEVFERGRETVAHMGETLEDFIAEIKSDIMPKAATATEAAASGAKKNRVKKKKVETMEG